MATTAITVITGNAKHLLIRIGRISTIGRNLDFDTLDLIPTTGTNGINRIHRYNLLR